MTVYGIRDLILSVRNFVRGREDIEVLEKGF